MFRHIQNVMRLLPIAIGLSSILTACQSPPTVEESAARCPVIKREADADKAAFHAKSPLHKEYAEVFGTKATMLALADMDARVSMPAGSKFDILAAYAHRACIPVHGADRCSGPVKEYAAYEERANKRMWEEVRYKCFSRSS